MPRGRSSHRPVIHLDKKLLDQAVGQQDRASLVDRIFNMVVTQIRAGKLGAGQRLHPVRQLADACEVSRDTVARAYDKLVAHGHLESRPGSGFFIKLNGGAAPAVIESAAAPPLPEWWRFRLVQPNNSLESSTGLGTLPLEWLDEESLGRAMRVVARASVRNLIGYSDVQGYLPLRQRLQEKLRDIQIDAPVARIMVTSGATHAIHLVVQAMLRTIGEPVLVEDPGPFLLTDRLMASGLALLGVPREADGPNLEVLRAYCIEHRPKLFFCNSILHNPTSGNISPYKAFQILRIAEEFDLTIVEDDTYADLLPAADASAVTRMASMDQLNRVIYIGSFSKTVAPGLRVGFVCANAEVIERLQVVRTVGDIAGMSVNERVAYQLLSQGGYRHHCSQLRNRLDACRQPVIDQLHRHGFTVEHPQPAGMYVWATPPGKVDTMTLADTLYKQGHLLAPGDLFAHSNLHLSRIRFNISRTLDSPALGAIEQCLRAPAR